MFAISKRLACLRFVLTRSVTTNILRIGAVTRSVTPLVDDNRSLIPISYYEKNLFPPSFIRHLEWLMKKDKLGQDALFVGPPGPTRRRLILAYLELTYKPYQYLQLTRDTTDLDIKQRREIQNKTALFINQAAVNAAIHGHTLVLDGLEKTERNVLPILNNLLENREMNLDNGQFLVSTQRFDELLKFYTKEQLDQLNFIRVHEDFRVIALTLPPLPEYKGHSLDPPLRSRFQLRDIGNVPLTFTEHSNLLQSLHPTVDSRFIENLLSLASLINSADLDTLKLTHFPFDRLDLSIRLAELIPNINPADCLHRIYPYDILYNNSKESKQTIQHMFIQLSIKQQIDNSSKKIKSISRQQSQAIIDYEMNGKQYKLTIPAHDTSLPITSPTFIRTSYHDQLLADLMLSHAIGDICIIGPKGCGKSLIIEKFASLLNYPIEYFVLYKDLAARELFQQRITNEHGDTLWQNTPLVEAAIHGRLLVLDGIHRLNNDTLVSLQRLLQDRELFLPDGIRLLSHDRYDHLQNPPGNIRRIHPSFRVIALAEPPPGSSRSSESSSIRPSSDQNWLNAETLNLFLYHQMRSLNLAEERQIVYSLLSLPNKSIPGIEHLLQFVHELRSSSETQLKTIAQSLSTRNVLRIAKHLKDNTTSYRIQLRDQLIRQTSAPFLPRLVQDTFYEALNKSGLEANEQTITSNINWKQSAMNYGQLKSSSFEHAAKIPFTIFYENPIHSEIIQQMHESFLLGEHLLLIGPQGVAKNRIVDHYLQTLKLPREYIQLHRDTTVQSLTIQASIIGGRIVYEDSPLIKAIKEGSVAVIDEADKAPTNVTGILKSLIESGSMFLSDGRRVYPKDAGEISTIPSNMIIRTHPNFRMIVLANRPGFPFLGNDFFLSLGDHFATFPILNPPRESEIILLQNFGPNIERKKLEQLVDVFTELRQLSIDGIISYPYSLRELVSIVKHLNMFPNDSLADVVRNIFDFDNYNTDVIDRIRSILHRYGIPFHIQNRKVNLAMSYSLKLISKQETWQTTTIDDGNIEQSSSVVSYKNENKSPMKIISSINPNDSRTRNFSELIYRYRLPLEETAYVHDLNILKENKTVLVVTGDPLSLWLFKLGENYARKIDLNSIFIDTSNQFTIPNYQLLMIPENEKQVVVGNSANQIWALVDLEYGRNSLIQSAISSPSLLSQTLTRKFGEMLSQRNTSTSRSIYNPIKGQLLQYVSNHNSIHIIDFAKNVSQRIRLPFAIRHVIPFGDQWILTDYVQQSSSSYLLNTSHGRKPILSMVKHNLDTIGLGSSGGHLKQDSLWFSSSNDYIAHIISNKNNNLTVERYKRFKLISSGDVPIQEMHEKRRLQTFINKQHSLIASFYAKNEIDKQFKHAKLKHDIPDSSIISYIELIDLNRHLVTYIPIQRSHEHHSHSSTSQHEWHMLIKSGSGVIAAQCNDGSLVTIDALANIHHWEIIPSHLQISLDAWSKNTSRSGEHSLDIEYLKGGKTDLSGPKHGKVDPENQPHVGGNQWAGGSGGRDTAGLGGIGGPYRLDSGHQVYQVPDDAKAAVPQHIRKAARELGQKVFKERLKEIEMSEYEHEVYEKYLMKISSEIKMLRSIIESLEAKSHDRQWVRHRTTGDWDERKLIEGIIGEKSIYKYRADVPPEPGSPQTKAKRLRLVVDLSASMYRFNGVDNRLERQCECVIMFLESLAGFEHKFIYDIVGHSGDEDSIELVRKNQPPKNNKERLKLLKLMYTHTMFCSSGDNTLPALKLAIDALQAEPDDTVDERFVVVISDANFDRYGLSPKGFGKMLQSNENVQCFAMFIGSLGHQAMHLQQNLPSGKGFVCLETSQIPKVLKTIFTSDVLH